MMVLMTLPTVKHACLPSFLTLFTNMQRTNLLPGTVMIVWQLDLQLPVQSVPITTESFEFECEVYSIQHYVIKFVSDLRQVDGFLRVLRFPLQIKLTAMNIAEILLKVTLSTIISPSFGFKDNTCTFTPTAVNKINTATDVI